MDTIGALGGMLNIPQWFVWRLTWDAEENKFQKVPCYPDGRVFRMDASDPSNWMTFSQARITLAALRQRGDGFAYTLGFWLSADTGYWFLDIDKCMPNGQLSPLAQTLFNMFPGAAYEWSSSGQGLHLFGRGVVPDHRRKDAHGFNLEFYTDKRGVAFGLSGQFWGSADTAHDVTIAQLVTAYFPPNALHAGDILDSEFDAPNASWHGPTDDAELIALIRSRERLDAGAIFAGLPAQRATFSDLYDGREDILSRCYPGHSDRDYALIGILSFWTGRDAIRTERIMRSSALYREKWESQRGKDTYIRYSILRQFRQAHAENRDVFGSRRAAQPGSALDAGSSGVSDNTSVHGGAVQPLVTVTVNTEARDAVRAAQQGFAAAGDAFELEAFARSLSTVAALDDGTREGLAHDLMERFEQLQSKRKITHCRAMLASASSMPLQPGAHRECTEFGNVSRFIDAHGDSLMYVSEIEQWYQWDGMRWNAATPEQLSFLATQTVYAIAQEARDEENEEVRVRLAQWARDSQKQAMVKNIVLGARAEPKVFARAANLDADVRYIGAPNCIIDLTTGAALAPDRNARITQYTSIAYNPVADAPWFKQTVREAFFDNIELVVFFKRLMGYALLGNPKQSWLIIPYGHGANGKSTIMNTIQRVMGDYCKTAASDTFTSQEASRSSSAGGPREDLVRLRTTRMLLVSEVEENAHLRESIVKSLTGDDTIVARGVLAKASVEYKPRFVPIMSTNHKPVIKGSDNGIWRRIMLIPFERNFREDATITEDLDRPQKIAAEAEGVLRWLVEGALEYQQFGITVPASIREATEEYRKDMDFLHDWIASRLEFDEESAVSVSDIWMSWQAYATPIGYLRYINTPTALTRKLVGRKGFKRDQHKFGVRGRCFVGVRLKTAAEVVFHG